MQTKTKNKKSTFIQIISTLVVLQGEPSVHIATSKKMTNQFGFTTENISYIFWKILVKVEIWRIILNRERHCSRKEGGRTELKTLALHRPASPKGTLQPSVIVLQSISKMHWWCIIDGWLHWAEIDVTTLTLLSQHWWLCMHVDWRARLKQFWLVQIAQTPTTTRSKWWSHQHKYCECKQHNFPLKNAKIAFDRSGVQE